MSPAGHSPSLRHQGLAHIQFASFGAEFARREWITRPVNWTGFPDVFSPRWESHCRSLARNAAQQTRGDPWCIGTFLDNELEWYGKSGALFDRIESGGLVLGRLVFAVHQRVKGQDQWVESSRIIRLEMQTEPQAWVVEAEVENPGALEGPAGYRARVRAVVFKELGLALVRPLWVESLDARNWRLVEVFWFCRSAIGGSPENDVVGGPGVMVDAHPLELHGGPIEKEAAVGIETERADSKRRSRLVHQLASAAQSALHAVERR